MHWPKEDKYSVVESKKTKLKDTTLCVGGSCKWKEFPGKLVAWGKFSTCTMYWILMLST